MRMTWFNGALAENAIAIDPQDRGLLLGDGVFETLLVLDGQPQWLKRHLARMRAAASELGIPFDHEAVMAGVAAVLGSRHNVPKVLRITLTRGKVPGGFSAECVHPNLLIMTDAFDAALMYQPVTLATTRIRRNERAPSSRLKALSYIDDIMAAREVSGHADDALMLNTSGRVACSTIANVFIVKGKEMRTPAVNEGILPGIIRGRVLETAALLGYAAREVTLEMDDVLAADAVFLTNSLRLMRPVTQLDGKAFGNTGLADLIEAMKPHLLEGLDT
jgi:branched-chain amino acid aminotransferase